MRRALGFDVDNLMREHPQAFKITAETRIFYGIGTLESAVIWEEVSRVPNLLWGLIVAL
jgi:hypothetical protein